MNNTANLRLLSSEQRFAIVRLILQSALDRIESGLPDCIEWADRLDQCNKVDKEPNELTAYERGALETAGMALSTFYATIVLEGMAICDALAVSDFSSECQQFVHCCWQDQGKEFKVAQAKMGTRYKASDLYNKFGYPDVDDHAKQFVAYIEKDEHKD